jgi:hypothetical protein
MAKHKDQDKKKKVKQSAKLRASDNNNVEFNKIIQTIREDRLMHRISYQTLCICRVETMEGTGVFKLVSKEGREYFGDCPGNLALQDMIGQIAKHTTMTIELQPLVLVLLASPGSHKKKPEILALITEPDDRRVTNERMSLLEDVGILFMLKKTEEIEFADQEEVKFEEEVDFDNL